MKLTVKTVTNKVFHVDANSDDTVGELKLKIESQQGDDYPAAEQKLIYSGKILKDEITIGEYKIDENGFLVIIVSKPKTSNQPKTITQPEVKTSSSDSNSSNNPSSLSSASSKGNISEETQKTPNITESTSTSDPPSAIESTFITGNSQMQAVIDNLMNMGFDKDSCIKALKASFNNPTRAVEYLINGIPATSEIVASGAEATAEHSDDPESIVSDPSILPSTETDAHPADSQLQQNILPPRGQDSSDPLAFLRNLPQFRQMRELVQQNPNLLQLFVQQLGQQNPQLLQRITENQERFIQMLNEPTNADSNIPSSEAGNTGANPPIVENQIVVTPVEREAIERLKAMGFPEGMVIQAYFACDKDENLAVNFLLTQNLEEFE
ncbi:unnamed protein product [Gordionus sp. m RMFG-2023]|uniref:UV excision repair protein RAD23 homolog A-like n=1 Tax=Gordionus sp. m RMFG-2023 TaxID=3053472 RepID=UPI0030E28EB2